jgi:cation transport ATPase
MMLPFLVNAMSKSKSRLSRIMSSVGIPLMVGVGLFFAVFLGAAGFRHIGTVLLGVIIILGSMPLLIRMVKNIRQGIFGVDIIAMLAIIGSVLLQEFVAGAVILLMLSGGE